MEFNEFYIDLNFQFITQYKIISLILKFFYYVTQTLFSRHQKLSSRLFLFETDADYVVENETQILIVWFRKFLPGMKILREIIRVDLIDDRRPLNKSKYNQKV